MWVECLDGTAYFFEGLKCRLTLLRFFLLTHGVFIWLPFPGSFGQITITAEKISVRTIPHPLPLMFARFRFASSGDV